MSSQLSRSAILALVLSVATALANAGAASPSRQALGPPLLFEPNVGQAGPFAEHVARGPGQLLALRAGSAVITLETPVRPEGKGRRRLEPEVIGQSVVMRLLDASPDAHGRPEGLRGSRSNYFLGSDRNAWRAGVPNYERVVHPGAWPGVDVAWHGSRGRLEVDFLLAAGVDPSVVRFVLEGGACVHLDADGSLVVELRDAELRLPPPVAWQDTPSGRRTVKAAYSIGREGIVSFDLRGVDARWPLTIDPVVEWSTYLGGGTRDLADDVAIGPGGSVVVVGTTTSADFPTINPLQPFRGPGSSFFTGDAFVSMLTADGADLVFSTWLGGPAGAVGGVDGAGGETAESVAIDATGNIVVVGTTTSLSFPTTPGSFQPAHGGCDDGGDACSAAFVAKIDPVTGTLAWSTYLGGYGPPEPDDAPPHLLFSNHSFESATDVAIDASGTAWVSGGTHSEAFPTMNAIQPAFGGLVDAFVAAFDPSGTMTFATYLGGPDADQAHALALTPSGRVLVTGIAGPGFPATPGAFQESPGGSGDAFVTSIDPTGPAIAWSTLLGGRGPDQAHGIATDSAGNAYVAGQGSSQDWPIVSAFQPVKVAQWEGFVTKLDASGASLLYSTWLGGRSFDSLESIAVDAAGRAHVVGRTLSLDYPLQGAAPIHVACDYPDEGFCGYDLALTVVQPDGLTLCHSELIGSADDEHGMGVALDGAGGVHVVGSAADGFPTTPGAYQEVAPGRANGVVMKLSGFACP